MANINKDFKQTLFTKTGQVTGDTLVFTNTDKHTSNIYLTVDIDLQDVTIYLVLELEKDKLGEKIEGVVVNEAAKIVEFNIPPEMLIPGTHKAQYKVVIGNQIRNSDIFEILVKKSITTGLGGD